VTCVLLEIQVVLAGSSKYPFGAHSRRECSAKHDRCGEMSPVLTRHLLIHEWRTWRETRLFVVTSYVRVAKRELLFYLKR
jgi:hypothetical protein